MQARLTGLHGAQLLEPEDLYQLENLLADAAEVRCTAISSLRVDGQRVITKEMLYDSADETRQRLAVVAKLDRLIAVSEALATDDAFARQVKRKFLA